MPSDTGLTMDALVKRLLEDRELSLYQDRLAFDDVIEDRPFTGDKFDHDERVSFYRNLVRFRRASEGVPGNNTNNTRSRVFPILETKTLLTEKQLQGHGLRLAGELSADRWLVPIEVSADIPDCLTRPDWYSDFLQRVDDLREISIEESLDFNEDSAAEAASFALQLLCSSRPSVFLIGNGNIRLLWSNEAHEQIALQFLGNNVVQFVLFIKRETSISERFGTDTPSEVLQLISSAKLDHLLK